jgi:hypothetical protein
MSFDKGPDRRDGVRRRAKLSVQQAMVNPGGA